jgi:hypothetical protein
MRKDLELSMNRKLQIKQSEIELGYLENDRGSLEDWLYTKVAVEAINCGKHLHGYTTSGKLVGLTIREIDSLIESIGLKKRYTSYRDSQVSQYVYTDDYLETILTTNIRNKGKGTFKITFQAHTQNQETLTVIRDWGKTYLTSSTGLMVYALGQTARGLTLRELGKMDTRIERGNYTEEVLNKVDYVIKEYNKESPLGRLTIINGPPGTGKTHLIKGMIPELKECLVVLLPTRLVGEIDGPSITAVLTDWKEIYTYDDEGTEVARSIVFILEDADECLVPRDSLNISTISSLLNYTDGILGSLLDFRIIATTNATKIEFDKAFTRPGRLCAHIVVDKVESDHAEQIYKRITEGKNTEYKEKKTLAEIYSDVAENKYTYTKEETKMGF